MKRIVLLLAITLWGIASQAVPADPTPVKVTQPDGTTLTLKLHGDEFFHFTTTLDGYTVLKNKAGYYTYARLDAGQLVPGERIARDKAERTAADHAALAGIPKGLTDQAMVQNGRQMLGKRNSAMRRVGADGEMGYENFRGLIILINYSDKQFSMPNTNNFYNDMVNTHDYTGYYMNGRWVTMTGSVRDYYYDNSANKFDPVFDIVGPINVSYACTYPQGTSRAEPIFREALQLADETVDFSNYDSDGDGYVDMVFFLVAGLSANYSGNDQNYLWPHMYYLYRAPMLDNVRFGLYACSTEIAGWEGYWSDVNGIGTFCHEFSHVLGLPDLYDTDYSDSGGESRDPGDWSIMAGGSGNNFGRNPVGYSLYERYALGFATPQLLQEAGTYTLQQLDQSNMGYRLNTPVQDEFFLIENRQAGKWDRFLPGHGMMIARVDSTDENVWAANQVNCNPNRMYYDLLRANYRGQDSDSDPFPGSFDVTSINNFTNPSLQSWGKFFNEFGIQHISEHNNVISFELIEDNSILTLVEDFEDMPVTDDLSAKGVKGVLSNWDFVKCAVESPEEGKCNGHRAVGMKKPSQLTTSKPLSVIPYMVSFTVHNPTSTAANVKFTYSLDRGETWIETANSTLKTEGRTTNSTSIILPTDAPIMLRFNQTSGNGKVSIYLDDIKVYYQETWPLEPIKGDVNRDEEVNIADINAAIDLILNGASIPELLSNGDVNGDGEVNIADVNMIIDIILGGSN
jgi:M6 family metalloprotease-like protein